MVHDKDEEMVIHFLPIDYYFQELKEENIKNKIFHMNIITSDNN
jgi:hypothetical protein